MFRIILIFSLISFSSFAQKNIDFESQISLAERYHSSHNREEVIDVLNKLLIDLEKRNNENDSLTLEISELHDILGLYYQNYGEWKNAGISYNKGIQLLSDFKENFDIKSRLNLHLGLLYVKLGDPNSKYYLDLAEEQALKSDEKEVLSILYKVTNRLDEGIKFTRNNNNKQYLSNYYYLKGKSYFSIDIDSSKLYFDSAYVALPELPEALLQNFQYHAFIVEYLIIKNDLDSALIHCRKARSLAPLLNDDEVDNHYKNCFASTYLAMDDTSKYLDYYNQSKDLQNKYKSSEVRYQLSELDNQRRNTYSTQKIIILEKRELAAIVLIVALILILIIIFFSIRTIYKINYQLKETNENMDRLFSIISHDLRGALAALKILSSSEKNIVKIEQGADALLLEFDSLLLWSSKHLDMLEINSKIIDVNEIVDEVIALSSIQSCVKKIRIDLYLDKDFIAFADENMFKIVVRNIVNNAIKYSRLESFINIKVIEKDDFLYLTVSDNGLGFHYKYKNKGFGLGLELCKDFLKSNNGELIISSSVRGSDVVIKIPIKDQSK